MADDDTYERDRTIFKIARERHLIWTFYGVIATFFSASVRPHLLNLGVTARPAMWDRAAPTSSMRALRAAETFSVFPSRGVCLIIKN